MVDRARLPCIVGATRRTWRPDPGSGPNAPEPLTMWEDVARGAAADCSTRVDVLTRVDSLDVVYCQTCQYDDPVARLAGAIGATPRIGEYSGIGGTTPLTLVERAGRRIRSAELDVALVVGAEALATKRRAKRAGETLCYSFPPEVRGEFPWEAPFHPAEVAHEVFQAWLTFAVFDVARRAHRGVEPRAYRETLGDMWSRFTGVAAASEHAWFRDEATPTELITPGSDNRMVGYPYTKRMVAVMDVDMAAAVLVMSNHAADALGVPADRRVYLRGSAFANDPTYVAEHADLWRSPAMADAAARALRAALVGIDDVAHLDLYSCFGSSVMFACDALGLDPADGRGLTVTGGLPYHGGPGSNYMTHSLAAMVEKLRADPRSVGLVSGVGMHMTKHAYGVYSTTPPIVTDDAADERPHVRGAPVPILAHAPGPATVAAYSVVHGRDNAPEWGLFVCDVPGSRCYAKALDPDLLARAEAEELVGTQVVLRTERVTGAMGETDANVVHA